MGFMLLYTIDIVQNKKRTHNFEHNLNLHVIIYNLSHYRHYVIFTYFTIAI